MAQEELTPDSTLHQKCICGCEISMAPVEQAKVADWNLTHMRCLQNNWRHQDQLYEFNMLRLAIEGAEVPENISVFGGQENGPD